MQKFLYMLRYDFVLCNPYDPPETRNQKLNGHGQIYVVDFGSIMWIAHSSRLTCIIIFIHPVLTKQPFRIEKGFPHHCSTERCLTVIYCPHQIRPRSPRGSSKWTRWEFGPTGLHYEMGWKSSRFQKIKNRYSIKYMNTLIVMYGDGANTSCISMKAPAAYNLSSKRR